MNRYLLLFFLVITSLIFNRHTIIRAQSTKIKTEDIHQSPIIHPVEKDNKRPRTSVPNEEIIKRFASKESEFRNARANYTFRQEVKIETIGFDDQPNGMFLRISDILFTDEGRRTERIIKFPPSTLQGMIVTPTDIKDLAGVQPFSLTTEELPNYSVKYIQKEKVDELNTFVFDIQPKQLPKYKEDGDRFFQGRIWVDDQDLQIVKTLGKAVPEDKNHKFPQFYTYRENVDGKYWFPTYTYADDTLDFPAGSIRMRMNIRYTNYKQFKTDIKILDEDEQKPKKN